MRIRTDFLHLDVFLVNGIRIVVILVFAYIGTLIVGRLLRGVRKYSVKMMLRAGGGNEIELEKRAKTIAGLSRKVLFVLIWTIAWLMILKEMNFDVRPLLAGAGVVGVAVGFGAQNIVKDILGGLFLMMENQIRVNDVAIINGKSGLVEEINLRTTVLRGEDGAVHIFPNGNIQTLSNLTREFSFYVFSLGISYQNDPDQAAALLREIAGELAKEDPYRGAILAPLEIWGVDQLSNSAVVIKARIKTLPSQQWMVGREMNRRIKKRFGDAHIDLTGSAQSVCVNPPADFQDQIKQAVREVLKERSSTTG
ncbi:MAG TPA: mechanosensitive ion channel domain-containing protein [Bryobacteraceae bacterium]|nr:mechanosensitive ion channel domain-containing protein [Bryobacteraceae bacterium]